MALRTDLKPQGATGNESTEALALKPFIGDIAPHRIMKPMLNFQSFIAAAELAGMNTGAPALTEVSTFGIPGLVMEAGDLYTFKYRLPASVDLSKDIAIELEWMSTNATAAGGGSVDFIVTYKPITIGTTAWAAPSTALDTVITAGDANLADYIPNLTSKGVIDGGTISQEQTQLLISIEADAVDTCNCVLTEAYIYYYRKYLAE